MHAIPSRRLSPIRQLMDVMAALRSPGGCPWDLEQNHRSLRWHAIEEAYELLDAIEAGDDSEMAEELGDLLLQVVFHAQLGRERNAFDFDDICRELVAKLIRRHPHVFGDVRVRDIDQVWANWEQIKRAEKTGSRQERRSALDGIPTQLPSLMKAQKLVKKARQAGLVRSGRRTSRDAGRSQMAAALFRLAEQCQTHGWSAENLLRDEVRRRERVLRRTERQRDK